MCMKETNGQAITFDESAELIAVSETELRLDLGHSILYRLRHPTHGRIVVLNSAVGKCAILHV